MTLGKNLILTLDGTAIAASKSCKIAVSQSFIDVCSPTEARVLSKQPTTYDWSMSSDCLVATPAYADAILDMVTNGTRLLVQCYDLTLGLFRSGYAYVQNADITGSVGSLMTLNISIVGSGALNKLNWDDIEYTLTDVDQHLRELGEDNFEWECLWGNQRMYIAIKQGNQYVKCEGKASDDLSSSIDDDPYIRTAHFKGGNTDYYLLFGTLSNGVVTDINMKCKITIPLIQQFSNTWFKIEMGVWTNDESQDPTYVYHFYADEIKVSRAAS